MKYDNLVLTLQKLEQKWRGSASPVPSPRLHPSHSSIRRLHNIQYFACSNATAKRDLPVVVTVGINYTQGKCTIPDETPHFAIAAHSGLPLVEDRIGSTFERICIDSFNLYSAIWRNSCLASMTMKAPILAKKDFHLIMTNLSPWITNASWATHIKPGFAADLLISPPHCLTTPTPSVDPLEHLDDLYNTLNDETSLWIGHDLDVVSSHFRFFTLKNTINNWLLTANTATGCKPRIEDGPNGKEVRFRRKTNPTQK